MQNCPAGKLPNPNALEKSSCTSDCPDGTFKEDHHASCLPCPSGYKSMPLVEYNSQFVP